MKASMVLGVALATGLLGSFRVVAEAAPACLGGRFLVEGPPLISATPNGEPDAVVIDGISISLISGRRATSGRITVAKTETKVNAVWPPCGGLRGKVRLRARVDPTCKTMTGTLRARREKWKRSFSAKLSECGDGIVDLGGGEECEPPSTVACDDRCQLVNGSTSTTTTTVTFTSSTTSTTVPRCGTFLTAWGSAGAGNGQFNYPSGVATDGSGNVYVADTYNNRIQKFDRNGTFLTTWGSAGAGNGQFDFPYGVATDGSGNVYVADTGNNRIQKFDANGTFLTAWGSYGSGDGQFGSPYGAATDESGDVYVAGGHNHKIHRTGWSG